MYLCDPCNKR